MSQEHRTEVDLDGLLLVLGEHLYSTPAVAVRELVQNAHDSVVRRRLESGATGEHEAIHVAVDRARRVLVVEDAGAGLTEAEVHQYLATVGRGRTREVREETGSQQLIGMFGLGFLSAFVVAHQVTVTTTSHRAPERTWQYRSSDGRRYLVEPADRRPVGTRVELAVRDEHEWLLEPGAVGQVLRRYCALLDVPVELLDGSIEVINDLVPPWRAGRAGRAERLEFAQRFEDLDALCPIDVVPSFGSDAIGLLWVQGTSTFGTSDNRNLSVYVRGMLLDDDARDLLPRWAGFVGGVVESNLLTPTASREDLQRDEVHDAVREQLEISLIDGLSDVATHRREEWRRVVARHNQALLSAALCDDRLFELLADDLTVPTSVGERTAHQLLLGGRGAVHVAPEGDSGFEAMLHRALDVPVARGDLHAVLAFLHRWCERRGAELVVLGTREGDGELFRPAALAEEERDWLAATLAEPDIELVASTFEPASLPFVVVPDREALVKRRIESDEADARIAAGVLELARLHTASVDGSTIARLYVNLSSPPIAALLRAHREGHPRTELAAELLASVRRLLTGQIDGRDEQGSIAGALDALGEAVSELLATS